MTDFGQNTEEKKKDFVSTVVVGILTIVVIVAFSLGAISGIEIERESHKKEVLSLLKSKERCEEKVLVFMNTRTKEIVQIRTTLNKEKTISMVRLIYPQNEELELVDELLVKPN